MEKENVSILKQFEAPKPEIPTLEQTIRGIEYLRRSLERGQNSVIPATYVESDDLIELKQVIRVLEERYKAGKLWQKDDIHEHILRSVIQSQLEINE